MVDVMDDIIWSASIKAMRDKFGLPGRISHVRASLKTLQNKTGLYADEHRAVIALYEELEAVIDAHDRNRAEAPARDAR